jgi:NADPH-dependent glutamate synthase beta subunit-like oxidoreductase
MLSASDVEPRRFVVVGAGKTAIDIARILVADERARLVALLGDSRKETGQSYLSDAAGEFDVPYLETRTLSDSRTIEFVQDGRPDYVISANNFLLFK